MTERARYITLATEFAITASEFAGMARAAIDEQTRAGVHIASSIRQTVHALEQVARLAGDLLRDAQSGAPIDLGSLQAAHDDYLRVLRRIMNAIEVSLRLN